MENKTYSAFEELASQPKLVGMKKERERERHVVRPNVASIYLT